MNTKRGTKVKEEKPYLIIWNRSGGNEWRADDCFLVSATTSKAAATKAFRRETEDAWGQEIMPTRVLVLDLEKGKEFIASAVAVTA